jgi:phosphoglycerate dehydrogenase-like enzyme
MFAMLRDFRAACRVAKLTRLIEVARRADEVLLGCKLQPNTRAMLQARRDQLEQQIRELQAN